MRGVLIKERVRVTAVVAHFQVPEHGLHRGFSLLADIAGNTKSVIGVLKFWRDA